MLFTLNDGSDQFPFPEEDFLCVAEAIGRIALENENTEEIIKELEQLDKPGVPGSRVKLGAIILLIVNFTIRFRLPDAATNVLLSLINFILPEGHTIPRSLYLLRKLLAAYVKLPTIRYYCSFCFTHVEKESRVCSNALCQKDLTKSGNISFFVLHEITGQIRNLFRKE